MKRNRGYVKRYIGYNLKNKLVFIIMGILFLAGTALGCGFTATMDKQTANVLMGLFGGGGVMQAQATFSANVLSAYISIFGMLLLLFFCGFCAISQPLVGFLVLFRGLGFGLMGGYLFATAQDNAIWYFSLVLLPKMLFSILVVMVAAKEALGLSRLFLGAIMPSAKEEMEHLSVKVYCLRFMVLLLLGLVAALADGAMTGVYQLIF